MTNTYDWSLRPEEEAAVIKIKEALHRHPELSLKEFQTSRLIRSVLERMDGVRILDLPIETGVVALIRGGASGKLVALRADIDGLIKEEAGDPETKSLNEGMMHACGHDFHTAAQIGAAQILSRNRAELKGDVLLIFQPAEEITAGATYLLDSGMYDEHRPNYLFGFHNRPDIPAGKVVAEPGYRMAGKYNFSIWIHGKSSHGGSPQEGHDPIVCAAALVTSLQSIVSRNVDPLKCAVLGIESIQSNNNMHQMVDDVFLEGSVRAHEDQVRTKVLKRIREMCDLIATGYGCKAELTIEQELPAVNNSAEMAEIAHAAAVRAVGEENIVSAIPSLGCEDFAILMQETPAYYYWVGSGASDPDDTQEYPHWHDPEFHTNDAGIAPASRLLACSVLEAQK